jgi:methyl-accepting chemotaxis protein
MIKNLSIKYKMITLITPLLIFIGVVGWVGMKSMKNANDALSTIYHDRVECLDQIMKIRDGFSIHIMGMSRKLVNKTVTYEEALKSFEKGQDVIDQQWKDYLSTYLVPEEAAIADRLKQKMKDSTNRLNSLHEYIKDKDYSRISKFSERELSEIVDPIVVDLSELAELQVRVSKETFNEHVSVAEGDKNFIISMIILSYLLSIMLAYKIILMITEPLAVANVAINKMADGNLNVEIVDNGSKDEIGEIIRSTSAIAKTLKNVDRDLREQIDSVREGSLSTRADAKQHPGSFADIVSGVNNLMDTLTAPMNEIASVMAKLASGDVRGRITGEYAGELRALKGNVNRSLDALVALLDAIGIFSSNLAKGDLTYKVDGNFQGEFAAIKQNLNTAVDQMGGVLRNVIETTQQVSVSANQTSAASKDVLEHTHNQTINLSEVSSAIEQTVAAITEIMKSTEQGSALAQNAAVAAENGETTLLSLSETVHSIADRNKRISQISELIGDIADKTYVLALNAGLEAVRAGNEGTGFGLIATKITTLAEEVAGATRSIKALIGEATESVEAGVQGATEAKLSIHQIVELSRQNGVTVQGIATSVEQQNAMMHTLKERVLDLKAIGQTTANAAEEISHTMHGLVQISQDLKKETDRIKIA